MILARLASVRVLTVALCLKAYRSGLGQPRTLERSLGRLYLAQETTMLNAPPLALPPGNAKAPKKCLDIMMGASKHQGHLSLTTACCRPTAG